MNDEVPDGKSGTSCLGHVDATKTLVGEHRGILSRRGLQVLMHSLQSTWAYKSTSLAAFASSSSTAPKSRVLSRTVKLINPVAAMPKHQAKKPIHKPQPTHFLCFSLVTDESVLQLSDSLAYFRSVTTRLPERDPEGSTQQESSDESARQRAIAQSSPISPNSSRKLQVIPVTAHRPPGTYHFTLGTMDLSRQEEMDKATALLHEIDYLALLRQAEKGGASELGEKRRGDSLRRTAGAKEAGQQVEAVERASSSDEGVRRTPASQKEAHSQRKPEDEWESPTGAKQDPSSQDTTTTTTTTTKRGSPSPVAQTLKSLAREISPPPKTTSHAHPPPLSITLHSLGVFPSPSTARVFFAHPIDPTRRLKAFSTSIRNHFNEAGLILDQRPLVLHATVANLIYVKREAKADAKRAGRARREGGHVVDAREILSFFNGDDGVVKAPPKTDERVAARTGDEIDIEGSRQSNHSRQSVPDEEVGSVSSAPETKVQAGAFRPLHTVPFIWARDIPITSIRICKMGAEPSDKPGWELEYRPVAEAQFMPGPN